MDDEKSIIRIIVWRSTGAASIIGGAKSELNISLDDDKITVANKTRKWVIDAGLISTLDNNYPIDDVCSHRERCEWAENVYENLVSSIEDTPDYNGGLKFTVYADLMNVE